MLFGNLSQGRDEFTTKCDFKRQVKMFTNIHKRFSPFLEVSFMFDKEGILNFKSSPIDEGLDKFLYLFNNRVYLEE